MRIPKGRPRPVREPIERGHLSYRARAIWWAATHRRKDRAPCKLAELYREMRARKPEKFYLLFEKYGDEAKNEWRPRKAVTAWRYRGSRAG